MGTITARMFRTAALRLTATVAVTFLCACSGGLKIESPAADAVIVAPAATHVVVTESGRGVTNFRLAVDGNDVSSQATYGSGKYVANLTVALGTHTVVASGDGYCSYCTGQIYQVNDNKTFFVVSTSPLTSKTIFALGDNLSWTSNIGPRKVDVATDNGTDATKWTLQPKGAGIGSVPGTIQSVQNPALCLRSPNNTNGAAIELALCDINDARQVWDGTREQMSGNAGVYQFRNEGVGAANAGCLAEGNTADGTVGQLVQNFCNGGTDRLWKVRHNRLMQFESDQTPWGQ
jgi:hypothetical protein